MGSTLQQIIVTQGLGKEMLREVPGKRPKDGPSLQNPALRMNNRDNSYVIKRDLGAER